MWRIALFSLFISFSFGVERESYGFGRSRYNDSAASLVKAFSAGCKSYGGWTGAAIAHTHALESVVSELKQKSDCSSISSALTSAQGLSGEIQRLADDPTQIQLKEAQENQRQLLLEYQKATDPNIQSVLAVALAQAQVALAEASAKAASASNTSSNGTLVRGLTQATSYLNTLLTDPNLGRCALQYPNLGVQIATQALGIAGTFVNPIIGPAISSAGQLMSSLISFMRNYSFDKKIWQLQSTEMAVALSCALESMTETYCGAEDQYRLTKLQADSYPSQWKPTEFWRGLDLWSRKIPGLLAWISKLASGVTPSDPSSADRQNAVWSKVQQVLALERSAKGYFEQTRRLLKQSPDLSEQIIRRSLSQVLEVIIPSVSFTPLAPPLKDFFPTKYHLLYKLVGVTMKCTPQSIGPGDCKDEQTIELPPEGFPAILKNSDRVFKDVMKVLLSDLHLVIDSDSRGLLAEATQKVALGNVSPIEVMQELITFLDESENYFRKIKDPSLEQLSSLIHETQALLMSVIDSILNAPGTPEGDQLIIGQLFQNFKLFYGTDFISERLYRHIKWDLNARIEHGDIPRNIVEILRASGRSAADEFDTSSQPSLDRLLEDISNAQSVSQQNIQNFAEFFAGGVKATLKKLKKNADSAQEPLRGSKRPNRRVLSRLCVLLASGLTSWPKGIDPKLCEEAEIESIYGGFEEKLKFLDLKKNLDQGERLENHMCKYRDFMRRSFLFGTSRPMATPREGLVEGDWVPRMSLR